MAGTSNINPESYYVITWRWLVVLAVLLVLLSGSTRLWVITPAFIASLAMTTVLSSLIFKYRFVWNSVIAVAIAAFAINQSFIIADSLELASLVTEVLIWTLPISLSFRQRLVGYWFAVLNICLTAVASILVSTNASVYGILILFLLMLVFNLNSANLRFLLKGEAERRIPIPAFFFSQFLRVLPVGIVAGSLIFFLFPRVPNLGASLGIGSGKSKTGYTGEINLSGGREIEESNELAFLVQAENPAFFADPKNDFLFRGNSVENFEGENWTGTVRGRTSFTKIRDLRIAKHGKGELFDIVVYREPSDSRAIFYPGILMDIQDPKGKIGGIFADRAGNLTRGRMEKERYSYAVTIGPSITFDDIVDIPVSTYPGLIAGSFKDEHRQNYSYMSEDDYEIYIRIPAEITGSQYFRSFVDSQGKELRILGIRALTLNLTSYFEKNFSASLVNTFSAADTLRAFLTTDHRGHCEYFATASALFFRSLGIPTRVVLGYRGGQLNPVSGLFEVREKNAHAWVEIYVPGNGWVPYDPTPIMTIGSLGSSMAWLQSYIDAGSFWFTRYVIDYDRDTQMGLFRSIKEIHVETYFNQDFGVEKLKTLIVVVSAFSIIAFTVWAIRRSRQRAVKLGGIPKYYEVFLKKISSTRILRNQFETFYDFHTRLAASGLEPHIISEIHSILERDLYSATPSENSERARIMSMIENIQLPDRRSA
jgi:hypothetical protein